ncbi:MLO-like protein 3 isoform X2 [Macadamia integrifolia]|uniref:MLO-like protein 3 isoform X2 n=1 Tax=Macadamia integrifolia TaxID=60698 RepID=UPI001C5308C9|nr:MLO-like protein 3 isoform X2 [Macadamia integrifolia]
MMGEERSSGMDNLQETPTWAVASICFILILLSIVLEHSLHQITNWLREHKKKALEEAVEKLKSELMLSGFISLVLAALQGPISNIYIPKKYANFMLPCQKGATNTGEKFEEPQRTGASSNFDKHHEGMVPLMSKEGIHQLHIFIFLLASTQLVFSLLIMALGRAKMSSWKAWEEETQSIHYQVANDPVRIRLTRETTFGRRHLGIWSKSTVLLWIKCFFRQFFYSVEKVDYFTLRHGFIIAHMPRNNYFNFQNYIQRSLEDDFKVVVGISPSLWLVVVILLLADVNGLHLYLWIAYFPLIIVLVLGTKLEVILARMALQLKDQTTVVQGAPLVQPDDNLFWFRSPRFVLSLIHFIMFMNAFELAFFLWATWQFGLKTCYHENRGFAVARVASAMIVQIICSYVTLPIYALVTQMGSQYRSALLGERVIESLKQWYARVKKKKQQSSSHQPLISHSNSELGSSRKTSPTEISSPPTAQPTMALAEIISSPGCDEISEVKKESGEANVPSEAVVVELSVFEVN